MPLIEIANKDRLIYKFYRKNRKKYFVIDKDFYPYYFEPDEQGEYLSIDGKRLKT